MHVFSRRRTHNSCAAGEFPSLIVVASRFTTTSSSSPLSYNLYRIRVGYLRGTGGSIEMVELGVPLPDGRALFPNNTYVVDSEGDPVDIPKLTFEEFKEFHRRFYHPSNARIWFYGDDHPNERLRLVSEYLDNFEATSAPNDSTIQTQNLFSRPIKVTEKYPASDGDDLKKQNMICVNWLLSDKPLDLKTELAFGFLDHLLLGTPASPLRKTLLESGLGEAIVGGGMEDEPLQPQFSIGLKGVSEEDIEKVENLVMTTLKKLAEEGFNSNAIEHL